MIIKLKGADFSLNNINSLLNSWLISIKNGNCVTAASNISSVEKNQQYSNTFTIKENYEVTGVVVKMGGQTLENVVTTEGSTITINITTVTAAVSIEFSYNYNGGTVEPEDPVEPEEPITLTLVQGYISGDIVNNELKTRVRIDGLVSGAFSVECNDGYVIRAIQECTSTTPSASDANIVTSDQMKTSYSGGSAGKYYAITFCKTNASSTISL